MDSGQQALAVEKAAELQRKGFRDSQFFILRSCNTVVAVIDKSTGSTWDVLRMVYGYTVTSAQHIAKFTKDYGNGKRYTWRDIPRR